jgi:hypothetical protein
MTEENGLNQKEPQNTKPQTIHYSSYQEFYDVIPEEGSLGILAMGAQGVIAWRRKREELKAGRERTEAKKKKSDKKHG